MEISEVAYIIIFGLVIITILIIFLVFVWLQYYKRNSRYLNKVKTMGLQFQHELLRTQIEIQEHTMRYISQEIHDNIGQVLSLAKLNLGSFPAIEDAALQNKVEDTKQLISKAIHDLRDLRKSMHGYKVAELGLQASIESELRIIKNTGHFNATLVVTGNHYKLEAQKEMVIFRIVQEALHNAIKHVKAKNIRVTLDYREKKFYISVTDDGVGFNPAALRPADTGNGLKSMQNRAALIGADYTLDAGAEAVRRFAWKWRMGSYRLCENFMGLIFTIRIMTVNIQGKTR